MQIFLLSSCYFTLPSSKGHGKTTINTFKWISYSHANKQISLGAGQPNPSTFPFAGMTITLKTGEKIDIDDELFSRSLSYDLTVSLMSSFNSTKVLCVSM